MRRPQLLKREESRSGLEPLSFLLTSLMPYRWAKPAHRNGRRTQHTFYTAWSLPCEKTSSVLQQSSQHRIKIWQNPAIKAFNTVWPQETNKQTKQKTTIKTVSAPWRNLKQVGCKCRTEAENLWKENSLGWTIVSLQSSLQTHLRVPIVFKHKHAHTHTHTHARTHARTHTRTHARTRAHTHARTHTRTHARCTGVSCCLMEVLQI